MCEWEKLSPEVECDWVDTWGGGGGGGYSRPSIALIFLS